MSSAFKLLLISLFAGEMFLVTTAPGQSIRMVQGESALWHVRTPSILLEGKLSTAVTLLNGSFGGDRLGTWRVELVPQVILRMSSAKSSPIKTPSYIPKLIFSFSFKIRPWLIHPYLTLGHHSNGQGGSTLLGDSGSATEPRFNTQNGSFSTNFIEVGYYMRLNKLRKHFVGISYEHHPTIPAFGIDSAIRKHYGRKRIHHSYTFKDGGIYTRLGYTRILDAPSNAGTVVSGDVRVRVPILNSLWLGVSYWDGQDYYNIHFSREIKIIKVGLSLNAHSAQNGAQH